MFAADFQAAFQDEMRGRGGWIVITENDAASNAITGCFIEENYVQKHLKIVLIMIYPAYFSYTAQCLRGRLH